MASAPKCENAHSLRSAVISVGTTSATLSSIIDAKCASTARDTTICTVSSSTPSTSARLASTHAGPTMQPSCSRTHTSTSCVKSSSRCFGAPQPLIAWHNAGMSSTRCDALNCSSCSAMTARGSAPAVVIQGTLLVRRSRTLYAVRRTLPEFH